MDLKAPGITQEKIAALNKTIDATLKKGAGLLARKGIEAGESGGPMTLPRELRKRQN